MSHGRCGFRGAVRCAWIRSDGQRAVDFWLALGLQIPISGGKTGERFCPQVGSDFYIQAPLFLSALPGKPNPRSLRFYWHAHLDQKQSQKFLESDKPRVPTAASAVQPTAKASARSSKLGAART